MNKVQVITVDANPPSGKKLALKGDGEAQKKILDALTKAIDSDVSLKDKKEYILEKFINSETIKQQKLINDVAVPIQPRAR
jgi:hypothetical protein